MLWQVLKKMQYQIPKADVDAVVQCKPGAIEQVTPYRVDAFRVDGFNLSRQGPQVNSVRNLLSCTGFDLYFHFLPC